MSHPTPNEHRPTICNIAEWFRRAKPAHDLKDASVQMGVHFEEVGEMLDCITGQSDEQYSLVLNARDYIKALGEDMKKNPTGYSVLPADRQEMLDALCDQIVTATGTGVFLGMKIEPALDHVDDSNWSKFVDGRAIFDTNGKIAKGPDFFRPDLSIYI